MKILQLHTQHVQLPLKVKFAQANNATWTSDSVIVIVETAQGTKGYGEACPRTYVTGEDFGTVITDLSHLSHQLQGRTFETLTDIREFVCEEMCDQIGLAATCGLELALLDAWAKETGQNLLAALEGTAKEELSYSGVIPMRSLVELETWLPKLKLMKFKEVKLKVENDIVDSLEKIAMIRQHLGQDIGIRIDANTSWTFPDAIEQIPVYLDHGIDTFEQIFPKDNLLDFQEITAIFGAKAKITVDESITSFESAKALVADRICNHFNLKISKHGGIFNTLKIYELATAHGITCQLGAHFGETSLLTAAGAIVASMAPELHAHEGAFGTHLLAADICQTALTFGPGGTLANPFCDASFTGLGSVVEESLQKQAAQKELMIID